MDRTRAASMAMEKEAKAAGKEENTADRGVQGPMEEENPAAKQIKEVREANQRKEEKEDGSENVSRTTTTGRDALGGTAGFHTFAAVAGDVTQPTDASTVLDQRLKDRHLPLQPSRMRPRPKEKVPPWGLLHLQHQSACMRNLNLHRQSPSDLG